ncbi:hypothetical protein KIN_03100 [Litoreibacter roseus]|uniref:Uncharacterized protein n=1 Tax=Litoreibacter roseus TaxID=2601869 RepID=A0A6N6JAS8_9RHOB|nr:hypothetical protein KIN_03100 [Litoreibacter roseus]
MGFDLVLDEVKECETSSVPDRREMGILNISETGIVSCNGGRKYDVILAPAHHTHQVDLLR